MNAFRRIATARPIATATASIALASVCFALVPLFARILLADGVSAEAIGLYRYLLSALIMLPFLPRRRHKLPQALMLIGAGLAMGLGWISYQGGSSGRRWRRRG